MLRYDSPDEHAFFLDDRPSPTIQLINYNQKQVRIMHIHYQKMYINMLFYITYSISRFCTLHHNSSTSTKMYGHSTLITSYLKLLRREMMVIMALQQHLTCFVSKLSLNAYILENLWLSPSLWRNVKNLRLLSEDM